MADPNIAPDYNDRKSYKKWKREYPLLASEFDNPKNRAMAYDAMQDCINRSAGKPHNTDLEWWRKLLCRLFRYNEVL